MGAVHETNHHVLETGERILGHTIAVGAGFAMAVLGVALCVTMVLLPIGLPLGLVGVLLMIWGLCFANPNKTA